jgi:glycosyltransferase involved in cell wall biosynthesis
MKILFLSDVPIQNPTSGSEQVLYQQAIGLALEGNSVFAITRVNRISESLEFNQYNNLQDACYGVDINNFFLSLLTILRKPPYLFDKLKNAVPFSLAISHQPLTCFSLILFGKLKSMPLLYVCHSPSHLEYELLNEGKPFFKYWLQVIVRRWVEKFCLKKSSKIIVLSRYMKQKIENIHQIPGNRIVVNPGGVDLEIFRPYDGRKQIKNELGLPENKIHLLTVRNLERRMGIDNLIKSIDILRRDGKPIHLTICGDGPEENNLKNMIHDLSLTKEITLTGFVLSEMLPKFYNAADFFILPTRKLEGFGLVTAESLACGTPVIGTPVGATKEILSNFNPNFLCRDSTPEAIAGCIRKNLQRYPIDQKNYKTLRVRCKDYSEINYSWQRHINELNTLIDQTIGTHHCKNPN